MFNDLNQANNDPRPAVDDIFAETDQAGAPAAGTPPASGIETHKIGLTAGAGEEQPVEKDSGPWFKIVVIAIVVVILALGGYLVYSKFVMAPEAAETTGLIPNDQTPQVSTTTTPVVEEVEPVEEEMNEPEEIIPLIPGVNAPVVETTTTTPATTTPEEEVIIPAAPIDTDQDGLTDEEEASVGTNINVVDTDGDGLSDYEEVNIYGTNPLLADSDSDGYSDGNEIGNGYDPLGPGKLSD